MEPEDKELAATIIIEDIIDEVGDSWDEEEVFEFKKKYIPMIVRIP